MNTLTMQDVYQLKDMKAYKTRVFVDNDEYIIDDDIPAPVMRTIPVRYWYMSIYTSDELGPDLTLLTFEQLWDRLGKYDIYSLLEVADSIARERVFMRLCDLYQVDYSFVYDKAFKEV